MTAVSNIRGLIAAWLVLGAPSVAAAQVLEIGPDGGVVTYAGPAVYTSSGVKALRRTPAVAAARVGQSSGEIDKAIQDASTRHAVSVPILRAVAWQESRFNQAAVSRKGALGVMQLLPETARRMGVDPTDLRSNIDGGAAYLSAMLGRFNGDLSRALAAYNAGPESVERYGGIPPFAETQAYVRAIMGSLQPASGVSSYAE